MRTYLMINTSYVLLEKPVAYTDTEMWRAWRDDNETWATYWCEPWDPRVALTPFLAHRVTPPPCLSLLLWTSRIMQFAGRKGLCHVQLVCHCCNRHQRFDAWKEQQ